MDGLPAMKVGLQAGKQLSVEPLKKMVGPLAPSNNRSFRGGLPIEYAVLVAVLSLVVGALLTLYAPVLLPFAQEKISTRPLLNTTLSGESGYLVSLIKR